MNPSLSHDRADADRLATRHFHQLATFINDYSGIKMPASKRVMLEGRLRRRLRETGLPSFADYCRFFFDEGGAEHEAIHLIDAVTTNKTDFFREPQHFDFLVHHVLPDLRSQGISRIRAWSSACSIGAEPYTLAMLMARWARDSGPLSFFILATDLSTEVLAEARRGIYPMSMLAPVPQDLRRAYIRSAVGERDTYGRVVPQLRSMVGFARLNLMDKSYPLGEHMHIVFCRNVLIYFDKETQAKVLRRICDRLEPGGYLFIGHSESASGFDLPLAQVSNTVFRRLPDGAPRPPRGLRRE